MVATVPHRAAFQQAGPVAERRLLLLSTNMGMGGGAEEQVLHLAYALQARGWEILIVSLLPPSPMPPGFAERGIPLVHLGMSRGVPDVRSIFRLARIIRDFQPQVVHSHMTHANLLARAVRVFARYPVLVCTLHALTMAGVEHDRTLMLEIAHRLTDCMAERTTAICHAAADYYVRRRAVPASKMIVVHNGIDSHQFRPDESVRERMRVELGVEDRFVWVAAGRLEKAKDYPTLLRAFARLNDDRATLLICGRGSLAGELEALTAELTLGERVRFLGLRSDVPAVMNAADGFVISSESEGLPLVLLQASAAGLPIVATDVGGNAEAVVEGHNGYLAPSADPDALARAMERVSALSPEERSALGRAGQARVRALFEMESVAGRWERLYAEFLGGDEADGSDVPPIIREDGDVKTVVPVP